MTLPPPEASPEGLPQLEWAVPLAFLPCAEAGRRLPCGGPDGHGCVGRGSLDVVAVQCCASRPFASQHAPPTGYAPLPLPPLIAEGLFTPGRARRSFQEVIRRRQPRRGFLKQLTFLLPFQRVQVHFHRNTGSFSLISSVAIGFIRYRVTVRSAGK